jgi:hypothetical protein
VHVSE